MAAEEGMEREVEKDESDSKIDRCEAGKRMCVFFFQAEDGIRDWSVTGVQTCALPISPGKFFDQLKI